MYMYITFDPQSDVCASLPVATYHCEQVFRPKDVFLHLVGILLHLQNQKGQAAGLAPTVREREDSGGGGGGGSDVRLINAKQNV